MRWGLAMTLVLLLGRSVMPQSAPPRHAGKLTPCRIDGVDGGALCGRYHTREMPDDSTSRPLQLNVVVLPATTESVTSDPLTFLAGGGVVPATSYAAFLARGFPNLRRNRDILLIDQRGTWNSNPLRCDPPPATIAACAADWATRADVRAYSTPAAARDLDDVRSWLGYDALTLHGVSYGTKVAQVYMKMFPSRVRAATLYGVVPLSVPFQLELAQSSQESLTRVFERCATDSACRSAFPAITAEFDSVLARLARAPVRLTAPAELTVTDRLMRNVVQGMLGTVRGIERIPMLIHAAYDGDYEPVTRQVLGDGPPARPPAPRGVFLSLLCSESLNQVRPEQIEPATHGSFFGADPVRFQLAQCREWPRADLPGDFWSPARAGAPVLALSGDLDPVTPPRYADTIVTYLPNARHLVLRNRSHEDVDPCITSIIETFLIRARHDRGSAACVARAAPLRFMTPDRERFSGARSDPGARTASGVRRRQVTGRAHSSRTDAANELHDTTWP